MCKAILTISSLRRSHNCRGFRYTKMLRQFVTAGVWRLSDAVIGYPCTAPLLCSCRGIIRLCRSMSVWSYFHAHMNFLTWPHSPQHSYSCNIFIEYCIARGLLLSIFLGFSQQFFAWNIRKSYFYLWRWLIYLLKMLETNWETCYNISGWDFSMFNRRNAMSMEKVRIHYIFSRNRPGRRIPV